MDQAMIQAVLDDERPDLDALEVVLVERAHDLLMASEMLREFPETAMRLMRSTADHAQQAARTVEIAVRVCANREHVDADCEHAEEADYREVSRRFADIAEHHVRQHKER